MRAHEGSMTRLPSIAAKLADALRNRRCECHTKELWPWKREEKCARCQALEEWDAFTAIVQTPVAPQEPRGEEPR